MAEKLPKANSLLLQHLLCLFHHISQRSETNKMDAKNLAVCIAPTLLHRDSQPLDRDDVEKVRHLVIFFLHFKMKLLNNLLYEEMISPGSALVLSL